MNAVRGTICVAMLLLATSTFAAKPPDPSTLPHKNGKPVYEVESLPLVPGTLAELYDESDVIADVRIDSSEGKLVLDRLPRTFYTATVLRTLKGEIKPRDTIVFSQAAGEVELADRIVQSNDLHTLPVSERYLVFVRQHAPYGGYILTFGRAGAFMVKQDRIEPQGLGSVADEQRNLTVRQLYDEIERIARRARPKR